MPRNTMGRVYVGDIGTIIHKTPKTPVPSHIDTSKLTYREMCNLALLCGVDPREIIGVQSCDEHIDMIILADKIMPDGFDFFNDCAYCRNCWQYYRRKVHIGVDDNEPDGNC